MSVKITVGANKCKIYGIYNKEIVDEACSAQVPGFQYSPKYRTKRNGIRLWDGYIRLFSRANDTFPVGLLDLVCSALEQNNIDYDIENLFIDDLNLTEEQREHWLDGSWVIPTQVGRFTLYQHQIDAIESFLSTKRIIPYRGIMKITTGAGKSLAAATVAKIVDLPTIFLVHGKKLTKQNLAVFQEVFVDTPEKVGTIDASTWNPQQITIVSVDTIAARLKNDDFIDEIKELFEKTLFLVSDEAHRSTSKNFSKVIKLIDAPMRLGLSGTPNRQEDDRDLLLRSLIGPVIYESDINELKSIGKLAKAELTCVFVEKPVMYNLEWEETFKTLIVENFYRHQLAAKIIVDEILNNRTILVLAGNSIALAESVFQAVTTELKSRNLDPTCVKVVNGSSEYEEVDAAFTLLNNKKLSCVITTTIADEGLDIPEADCLVLLGGGKSYIRVIQRVGRIIRSKKTGVVAKVYDFMDLTNKYLEKHCEDRLTFYELEKIFDKIIPKKASFYLPYPEEGAVNGHGLVGDNR